MKILGIPIDNLTRKEILLCVETFLDEPKFHQIATVNPEFLREAEKNTDFRTVLLDTDLRVADGFGIVLAGLLRGTYIERFPGADLMDEILHIANRKKLPVYLAVRADGLSTYGEVKAAISKKYPNIEIAGADVAVSSHHVSLITYPASLIFCNFGAPEQEIFLSSLKGQNTIRIAMGVGGSFDYLTGKQKRAPQFLRAIGLEWLWRLIRQPKRWRRIWNALVVFPFLFLSATIQKRHMVSSRTTKQL